MTTKERHWLNHPLPISIGCSLAIILVIFVSETFYSPSRTAIPNPLPSPSASISVSSPDCSKIRLQRIEVEESEEIERNTKLEEIHSLQRSYILQRVRLLLADGVITSDDQEALLKILEYSKKNRVPLSPFSSAYIRARSTLENLLSRALISKYLVKEAQEKGIALARWQEKSEDLVLDYPECFDELEVTMIQTLRESRKEVRTYGWTQEQTSDDLVQIMSSRF